MRIKSSLVWLSVALFACASPRTTDSPADAGFRDTKQGSLSPSVAGSVLRARDLTLHLGSETRVELADAAFTLSASELTFRGSAVKSTFGNRAALLEGAQPGEHFRVRNDEIEQYWTFTQEPEGDADVVIRVPVSGLSYVGDSSRGLTFRAATGQHVYYSHATFRDAAANATKVPARFVAGAIEMVLPRAALRASTYPAELDPSLSSVLVSLVVEPTSPPAVAYSPMLQQFAIAYRRQSVNVNEVNIVRVTPEASVIDPSGFFILQGGTNNDRPALVANAQNFTLAVYSLLDGLKTPYCMTFSGNASWSSVTRVPHIREPFVLEPGTTNVWGYVPSYPWNGGADRAFIRAPCDGVAAPAPQFIPSNPKPFGLRMGNGVFAWLRDKQNLTTIGAYQTLSYSLNSVAQDAAVTSSASKRAVFFTTNGGIKASQVASDGAPTGSVVAVSPESSGGAEVHAAFDGAHFVVARTSGADLQLLRLTPEFTQVAPGFITVASVPGGYLGFDLASDGNGHTLLAYVAQSASEPDRVEAIMFDRDANSSGAPGIACINGLQCASGYCVDGVCCDSTCGGGNPSDCQACSVAQGGTRDGTCLPLPASTVCRASRGVCDDAEQCDGVARQCPADTLKPKGFLCGAKATGPCDLDDMCDGQNEACLIGAREPSSKICRPAVGPCDAAERCSGTDAACPSDTFLSAAETCRPAQGPCDRAERCTGGAITCPTDALEPATTVCRAAQDLCDAAEYCDGSSIACGADLVRPVGTSCRPKRNDCDEADYCDGTSKECTPLFAPAGTVCRAANGVCDVDDVCTGTDDTCPVSFAAKGTVCRPATGICDIGEVCAGDAPDCPKDAFVNTSVTCRESAGPCDVLERCDGQGACPADSFARANQVCRPQNGVCDVTEVCSGLNAACGPDVLQPKGRVCAVEGEVCGACDGMSYACGEERSEALCEGPVTEGGGGDSGCTIRAGSHTGSLFGACLLSCFALVMRTLGRRRRASSQTCSSS